MKPVLPVSCDTFVVLPPFTSHGGIIFGKNSDRPNGEVQELIYVPATSFEPGSKLQCTYIEVDQCEQTNAVILSKPAWMWGAEMGANNHGLVIGNEAVWTSVEDDKTEKLLGMDLLRLALERSATAESAVKLIAEFLASHGQGGRCSDSDSSLSYHNSFLMADNSEAWVMETAGPHWAAKRISSGFCNISNCLTLADDYDLCSEGLSETAVALGNWKPSGENSKPPFALAFGDGSKDAGRYNSGQELLKKLTKNKNFGIRDMFEILRDEESGICRSESCSYPTTGSQVSVLSPSDSDKPNCHWFTATPDPSKSVFKPFIFTPNVHISQHTVSPVFDPDPAKVKPRFQQKVDRSHHLYKLRSAAISKGDPAVLKLLRDMENGCVSEMETFISEFKSGSSLSEVDDLLKDIVETEVKFYK